MWATAPSLAATEEHTQQIMTWLRSGKTEQRVAFRCHIILHAIAGKSNNTIATELRTSRPTVILWRNRFEKDGPQALCDDLPRGRSFPTLSKKTVAEVVTKTTQGTPKDATH